MDCYLYILGHLFQYSVVPIYIQTQICQIYNVAIQLVTDNLKLANKFFSTLTIDFRNMLVESNFLLIDIPNGIQIFIPNFSWKIILSTKKSMPTLGAEIDKFDFRKGFSQKPLLFQCNVNNSLEYNRTCNEIKKYILGGIYHNFQSSCSILTQK